MTLWEIQLKTQQEKLDNRSKSNLTLSIKNLIETEIKKNPWSEETLTQLQAQLLAPLALQYTWQNIFNKIDLSDLDMYNPTIGNLFAKYSTTVEVDLKHPESTKVTQEDLKNFAKQRRTEIDAGKNNKHIK